jgi:hypothetical protein
MTKLCGTYTGSVSHPDPNPDPHSMGFWIRSRRGKISPEKEEKISLKTTKNGKN